MLKQYIQINHSMKWGIHLFKLEMVINVENFPIKVPLAFWDRIGWEKNQIEGEGALEDSTVRLILEMHFINRNICRLNPAMVHSTPNSAFIISILLINFKKLVVAVETTMICVWSQPWPLLYVVRSILTASQSKI